MDNHRTLLTLAALGAAVLGVLIWGISRARAGTYTAAQCHAGLGAGHADLAFERSSDHYRSQSECGPHDGGLSLFHRGERTAGGRWGAWLLRAPEGAEIVRIRGRARGRARDGHLPELLVGVGAGAQRRIGSPHDSYAPVDWSGSGARTVTARLRCSRSSRCGAGETAGLHLRRLLIALRDRAAPTLGLGGPALTPGSRRGTEELTTVAADAGGGVRRIVAEVNGDTVHAGALACSLARGIGLRLRPCPSPATVPIALATASPPFRQGPNSLRVCALDLARGTNANRACESRRLRVDNACPLSAVGGTRLQAHLQRRATVDGGERATVVGRVLDGGGTPVGGARVCVAARTRLPSTAERVVRTPVTDAGGRFRVRLPHGPNREVRVAHWPTAETALERFISLRVRARPRLRIPPGGPIRNGERARFQVRLPGPAPGHRRVTLQASAGGRWIPVRNGRTDRRGRWRTTYRFRATTGERTYRFRALVPRQRGYPYAAGHSEVRRQTVVGP